MLVILSPAKKLLPLSTPYTEETTTPLLLDEALALARVMKSKSVEQIAELMDLSSDLAFLNYERYQHFHLKNCPIEHSYPALLLFQGDVYQGLSAKRWTNDDLDYSQRHLAILSGLYGMLRPLDRIQPYRLEMGVTLANSRGKTLYDFWRESITTMINQQLSAHKNPVLINLASAEYFKAIDPKRLQFPILTVNFYEHKNNETKMIGIYAKKARGLMAKYLMLHRVESVAEVKAFSESGYCYDQQSSSEHVLNFIRMH